MIDMHNHVLFGVDDGCKTIEESIQMIEKAIEVGVTDIIVTPHYGPTRGYVVSAENIRNRFETLQQAVLDLNLDVKLYLGREIDEVEHIEKKLKNGTIETLNNTNYVLVDFGMKKADIDEYCYELVINGFTPIIAHPERYNYISSYSEFHKWRETGALLQINANSLFHPKNRQTKKYVKYLLKHNLVDLVGSDCHRNEKSYEYFAKAFQLIEKKYPLIHLKQGDLLGGDKA